MKNSFFNDDQVWYVLRDLKPKHAKLPAYKLLREQNITCYTPLVHRLVSVNGKQVVQEVPFMSDLLFVKASREQLDAIIEKTPKLQYRYKLGAQRTPMVVRAVDMEHFIQAVESTGIPKFYAPNEVTMAMRNRKIRIIGGGLNGYTGTLVSTRGSKTKRLLIELPNLIAASVEVEVEFIQFIS